MKLRFTIEFDIDHDWDDPFLSSAISDFSEGRKAIVGNVLRRATTVAVMTNAARALVENGVNVVGVSVSLPQWDGWDNERIAREMVSTEGER